MHSIKWRCFRWPWVTLNPQTTPISAFFVAFHIFVVSECRYFKFDTLLNHNQSQHTDDKSSLKGSWLWSRDPFKFLFPPKISPERLKLETWNFVHWFAIWCFSTAITNCSLSGRSGDAFYFWEISDNISETVQDRHSYKFTIQDKYEITYVLSNSMIANDLE